MNDLINWVLNLPKYFGQFGEWLNTPIGIGNVSLTPLAMLGASAGVFVGVLVALKIKSLIIA